MTLFWNVIGQSVAMLLQVANQFSGAVPPKWQPGVALGVGILQAVGAFVAHFSNPDGTSARAPWNGVKN